MKKNTLVLVGQTPPPYNGQTVMIEVLRTGLDGQYPLEHVRMSYSASIDEVGKPKLSKFLKLFSLIHATRTALKRHPGAILYYPPASPNLIPVIRDILYLPCVRYLAKKTVYHFHAYGLADYLESKPLLAKLAKWAYGRADLAVVPASCCKDPVFLQSKRVETVPYGRNIPAADLRSPFSISHTPTTSHTHTLTHPQPHTPTPPHSASLVLRILFVGIHTEGKGFFDLIETARELKQRHVPFQIRCAGMWAEEEERARAEELISRYELQSAITLLGNCTGDTLWREYANADVLFFPTKYVLETLGMVVVEAMAFRLPVVSSNWRGPKDVVVDGQTGTLCEPGSITAYADALADFHKNPDKRAAMGLAGRKRYEECYTEERYIQRWIELLDEI